MRHIHSYLFVLFTCSLLPLSASEQKAPAQIVKAKPVDSNHQKDMDEEDEEDEEYYILNRDEIDNSNTLAIPFDDSEIEDEEEINRDEKKDVFPLPHSR